MGRHSEESDSESVSSSSTASLDEEEVNLRARPSWCAYRHILASRGFRLDTCRDVKQFYQVYLASMAAAGRPPDELAGYARACKGDDDELCKDAGLPEHLFRGTRCKDGMKVVIKAVNIYSREFEIMQYLRWPYIRRHKMNHCIPILDLIEVRKDQLAFIVMEEWSPLWHQELQLYSLHDLLEVSRQCIEHVVFLHSHNIAHLDITLRNVLTDCHGRYALIDYETSRRFEGRCPSRIRGCRAAEEPPEVERGEWTDPFKVDVWALGIFMQKVFKFNGDTPTELVDIVQPMLSDYYGDRPTAEKVLSLFEARVKQIGTTCPQRIKTGG